MALIGWYKLDGNGLDSSGNGFHNETIQNISWVGGMIEGGASFNGTSSTIDANALPRPTSWTQPFSFCVWINIPSSVTEWSINNHAGNIMSRGSYTGSYGLIRHNSTNNVVRAWLRTDNAIRTVDATIVRDKWHHLIMTWDGVNTLRLYIDGDLKGANIFTPTGVPEDTPLYIGRARAFAGGVGNWYQGLMDDVRVYDHALSSAEAKELSQAKVIHSKFLNDPTDGSGFNYHGTEESTLYTTSAKTGTHAYLGDGTTRAINYGLNPSITRNKTVAMWIYRFGNASRMNPYNKNYGGEGAITHEISGQLNYYWGISGGNASPFQSVTCSELVGLNVWAHIAVVRNLDDGYIRWFVNGVPRGQQPPTYDESAVSTGDLLVGRGYTTPYNGIVDDFRLYATALTNDDILEIYKKRAGLDNQGNLRTHNINEHLEISNFKTPQGGSHDGSYGLRFTVKKPLVIRNALVRPYFTGNMTAQLYDFSTGVVLQETPPTPVVSGNIERVDLNLFCKPGISYWLTTTGGSFMRTDAGVAFPIDDGLFNFTIGTNITGTAADRWYYFFDIYYSASSSLENSGIFQSPKFSEAGITNGISGWWNFEGNANDVSGNGNDGIVSGAEIVGGVNNSGAYYFDGIDDYIRVDNNFTNNITELTTACWLKNEGGSSYRCAVHKAVSTAVGTSEYWIGVSTGNFLTATIGAIDGVGGAAGETTTTAVVGEWYHMTATWDGNVVRVYVNGVYNKQYNLSTLTNLPTPTRFGASNDGIQYQFTGIIDDVRIYNRALSAEEIGILYDVTGNSVNKMKLTKDSIYIKGQIKETL